jgi:hypothetical protein
MKTGPIPPRVFALRYFFTQTRFQLIFFSRAIESFFGLFSFDFLRIVGELGSHYVAVERALLVEQGRSAPASASRRGNDCAQRHIPRIDETGRIVKELFLAIQLLTERFRDQLLQLVYCIALLCIRHPPRLGGSVAGPALVRRDEEIETAAGHVGNLGGAPRAIVEFRSGGAAIDVGPDLFGTGARATGRYQHKYQQDDAWLAEKIRQQASGSGHAYTVPDSTIPPTGIEPGSDRTPEGIDASPEPCRFFRTVAPRSRPTGPPRSIDPSGSADGDKVYCAPPGEVRP